MGCRVGIIIIFVALFFPALATTADFNQNVTTDLDWQENESTDPDPTSQNAADGVDYGQEDLEQWRDACGDDPNEYLIKQHDPLIEDYDNESSTSADKWGCATKPDNCYYNSTFYSEGQSWNLSQDTVGGNTGDYQVCLNYGSSPMGEFYDLDADHLRNSSLNNSQFSSLEDNKIPDLWGKNPGTVDRDENSFRLANFSKNGDTVKWNNGFSADTHGRYSENFYRPVGYATQKNCALNETECDDAGQEADGYFNAGEFTEGASQDNKKFGGVHNKQEEDSDQFQPSSDLSENWITEKAENQYGDKFGENFTVTDYNSTTPGPETWALTEYENMSIGNDGKAYMPQRCYGGSRTNMSSDSETKFDRVFGNSFADRNGEWQDPDDLGHETLNQSPFSCDLTGPDKGIGFKNNSEGYENFWDLSNTDNYSYIVGDIKFQTESSTEYEGSITQEMPVCGDDNFEYLIEEQGESNFGGVGTGPWGCGIETGVCIAREAGEKTFYDPGSYLDVNEQGEDHGRLKNDREKCEVRPGDNQGTWYDQDFSEEYCNENLLYGELGKRWIDSSYIESNPYAVTGGINDDYNPYLGQKNGIDTINSTQGDASSYENKDEDKWTPVPTGLSGFYENQSVNKGFCGGDDDSEYLVNQISETRYIQTDNSVIGVSRDPNQCVLDEEELSSSNSHKLYEEGETESIEEDGKDASIACFNGKWWGNWPVAFLEDKVTIGVGQTVKPTFQVINPETESRTIKLNLSSNNDEIEEMAKFEQNQDNRIEIEVGPESSTTMKLEIDGNQEINDDVNLTGESLNGDLKGYDTMNIEVTQDNSGSNSGTGRVRDVPGLTIIQLVIMSLIGTAAYYFTN